MAAAEEAVEVEERNFELRLARLALHVEFDVGDDLIGGFIQMGVEAAESISMKRDGGRVPVNFGLSDHSPCGRS